LFKFHCAIEIPVLQLVAAMTLFRPDTQEMISEYHSVAYKKYKKVT
jgi:hypothetical protein